MHLETIMKILKRWITLGLVSLAALGAHAQTVYGVTTDNALVSFDANNPTALLTKLNFTGLVQPFELILGIDIRPATGELYAMGSSNRIYKVDPTTGAATAVGAPFAPSLNGIEFGFDFNPTVDRIRVTSDNGQNLRLNPITGAVAAIDTSLAYAAGDPNAAARPNIVGSAYTNNFAGATTTTLFNIDSNLDILTTQVPPNNGTLNTVGGLGFNVSSLVGFDIVGSNSAYAALTLENDFRSGFYTIDLTSGRATQIGAIGGTALQIRDITVVPEPASAIVLGSGVLLALKRRRKA